MPTSPVFHFLSYNTFTFKSGDLRASFSFALLYSSSHFICLSALKVLSFSTISVISVSSSLKNAFSASLALPILPAAFMRGAITNASEPAEILSFVPLALTSAFTTLQHLPLSILFTPSATIFLFSPVKGILSATVAIAARSINLSALLPMSACASLYATPAPQRPLNVKPSSILQFTTMQCGNSSGNS